jgi:hypothetical protein
MRDDECRSRIFFLLRDDDYLFLRARAADDDLQIPERDEGIDPARTPGRHV